METSEQDAAAPALARVETSPEMPRINLSALARTRGSGQAQQAWRGGAWRAPSRWRSALVWGVVQARLAQSGEADLKSDEDEHTYG